MHKILIIGDLPTRRNFRAKKKFKGVSFKMSSVVFSPQHFQKSRNSCYCILKMFCNLSKKKPKCNAYIPLPFLFLDENAYCYTKYTKTLHVATSMYLTYSI